jgi:PAS domain S-box-containing protein
MRQQRTTGPGTEPLPGLEEQQRLILECVQDVVVFFLDAQGQIVGWNEDAGRLLGHAEADVLGRHFGLFFTLEDRRRGKPENELLRAAGEGSVRGECFQVRADGQRLWTQIVTAVRRDETGRVAGFARVVRDRSEQKRAEEAARASESRFRALVENAWDGVTLIGADGTVLETTPITFRGLGYSPEEYVGRNGLDLLHPDDAPIVQSALARLLGQPGDKVTLRYRLRHRDGSWRWVDAIGCNLLDEPSVRAIVVNHRDVTEQQQLEDELRKRAQELVDADRRKNEFLATLAHELRNPLAAIRHSVELMKVPDSLEPISQTARAVIDRQSIHLARLVDDLLDVSRIAQGKFKIQKEILEVAMVVAAAVEIARPLVAERRHELTVLPPGRSIHLEGDPTRLAQMLGNLLINAAKYTPERGRIWLSAGQEGDEVVFRVRDRGLGIPAEMQTRIFDLFTQVERGSDRAQGGLGIGLALVKSLAQMHGGTVKAFSEGPGQGSEFVVRLPARQAVSPPGEAQQSQEAPGSPRRILVVDDNRDTAESLALLLRGAGHQVRTAHDGPAALEAVRNFHPKVVLLDIGLPRMDGYEVARLLRQEHHKEGMVLVALTGYGQEEDRHRSQEAGFDHHLVKPAAPEAIRQVLADEKLASR